MIRPQCRDLPAVERCNLPAGERCNLYSATCTCEPLEAGAMQIQSESVRRYVRSPERSKLLDASTTNSVGVLFDGAPSADTFVNSASAIPVRDWQRIDEPR